MIRRIILICVFFVLFLVPVVLLFFAFQSPVFPATWPDLLFFSFSLAALGTTVAFLIGLPVSFCAAADSFFARLLGATVLVPFFLPISIGSVLIYQVFQDFSSLFSIDARGSFIGLILAHGFYEAPIVIFYLSLALRGIPSVYLVQMKEDGLSVFRQCLFCLCMIGKQIFQALVIVFLYIFQSTALVINIGLGRYETLESSILLSFGQRSDFSAGLGLSIIQALFLWIVFAKFNTRLDIHFSLSQDKQICPVPVCLANRITSVLFLAFVIYWLSPLFIRGWQGINQLYQVRTLFPLYSSLLYSFFISVLAAVMAIFAAALWLFYRGGSQLVYSMSMSQVVYFSGVMACGFLWNIPSIFLAVWGLSLSLIPIMYFFLKASQASEDERIIASARLDNAHGWALWSTMYWPLWKERYLNAFWNAVLISFGNFPFAYIMAQNKIPMATMTLVQLLNRRYIAAANAYSVLVFMMMLLPLLFLSRNNKKFI